MHRGQVRVVEQAAQTHEGGVLHIPAGRRRRQEVRLVDHDEIPVLVEDLDVERDVRLRRRLAVVPDEFLRAEGSVAGDGGAVHGDDLAIVEARQKPLRVEVEEALDHVCAHSGPRARERHVQTGGTDAVADGEGGAHRHQSRFTIGGPS
jgi:hypothetical protein